MINGEITWSLHISGDGYHTFVKLDAYERLLMKYDALLDAVKRIGIQCVNTGNYGPLGLAPGECKCSTCNLRATLAQANNSGVR